MRHVVSTAHSIPVHTPDTAHIGDGTYKGEYTFGPVYVKVAVTLVKGKIVAIDLLKHDHGLGKAAENITQDIIHQQSLEIDTISHATISSKCILKAVEQAFETKHQPSQ